MKDGFIKIACATPDLKVADCEYNADRIIELVKEAEITFSKTLWKRRYCILQYFIMRRQYITHLKNLRG